MNKSNAAGPIGSPEILAHWEGPALHEPGVLFEEHHPGPLSVEADAAELAEWVAVTALSGEEGHSTHEAIKAKVVGVLRACRQRFGQVKIDAVKQQLYEELRRHRRPRKLTDEQLRERIERLFDDIRA